MSKVFDGMISLAKTIYVFMAACDHSKYFWSDSDAVMGFLFLPSAEFSRKKWQIQFAGMCPISQACP